MAFLVLLLTFPFQLSRPVHTYPTRHVDIHLGTYLYVCVPWVIDLCNQAGYPVSILCQLHCSFGRSKAVLGGQAAKGKAQKKNSVFFNKKIHFLSCAGACRQAPFALGCRPVRRVVKDVHLVHARSSGYAPLVWEFNNFLFSCFFFFFHPFSIRSGKRGHNPHIWKGWGSGQPDLQNIACCLSRHFTTPLGCISHSAQSPARRLLASPLIGYRRKG